MRLAICQRPRSPRACASYSHDLTSPHMSYRDAYISFWQRALELSPRTSRQEYWKWWLLNLLIILVMCALAIFIHPIIALINLYDLAIFIPSITIVIRRLHDSDHSGWWLFIWLVPIIGWFWALYLMILPGTPGVNRFGPPR